MILDVELVLLLLGGELIVICCGNGVGGLNVEFCFVLVVVLNGVEGIYVLVCDMDGVDGVVEVVGVVIGLDMFYKGVDVVKVLDINDVYSFFVVIGD